MRGSCGTLKCGGLGRLSLYVNLAARFSLLMGR